jgi:hypothetical protein
MPSNRELKEEAEALGVELGVSVDTEGLGNSKLKELVESLYAQLDAKGRPGATATEPKESPGPAEPVASAPKPKASMRYVVAPRHSVVGKRGVRGPGKELLPTDIGGDDAAARARLNELAAAGVLVRQ